MEILNSDLITERCLLRKYKESDREEFIELSVDGEVNFYMGGKCETRAEADKMFDKILSIYEGSLLPRHFEIWAIVVGDVYAGHFELKQTEYTASDELEIVYLLNKAFWGNGLMPEIIKEVRKYSASMNRHLTATVSLKNIKTLSVLSKVGIQKQEPLEDPEDSSVKIWINPISTTK